MVHYPSLSIFPIFNFFNMNILLIEATVINFLLSNRMNRLLCFKIYPSVQFEFSALFEFKNFVTFLNIFNKLADLSNSLKVWRNPKNFINTSFSL